MSRIDQRVLAAALADLPASVAQEAGEFYQNAGGGRPRPKREAMAVARKEVLRPYLLGLRDGYAEQARPALASPRPGAEQGE